MDCAGVLNGTAFLDNCDNCVGGNTGVEPCLDTCLDTFLAVFLSTHPGQAFWWILGKFCRIWEHFPGQS